MEFKTKYTVDTGEYVSVSGEPTLQDYKYHLDEQGHKMLIPDKDSYTDVYARIQADYDSTDINLLMKRFALGDTEALNVNKGFYLDTRQMPKTMAEVFSKGLEAEQYFNGLPSDLKEMFDNSHSVFFTEMGTKSFDAKIEKYNDSLIDHSFDIDPSEIVIEKESNNE